MGQTLATWEARVQELLGHPSTELLPTADIDKHIYAAVRRFSADRSQVTHVDLVGNGVAFEVDLPTDWVVGFSQVEGVEYPQGERPAQWIDLAEVVLYPPNSAPTDIRLNDTTPATGETARIFYSLPWPLPTSTAAVDKISATDYEPVAKLAASYSAEQLAGRAAMHIDPTLPSADLTGVREEIDRWRLMAKDYAGIYNDHVGAADGGAAATAVVDWDATPSWLQAGRRFLFRPRRR